MTAGTVVRFEARGAVAELFRRKDREVLLSGAAGTGKSVGALMKIHLACLQKPRTRVLILRKTLASLTGSTLVTFREKVASQALSAGLLRWYGGSRTEPAAYKYANGSTCVVGGLDNPTRILSTDYDLIFVDEAIECTEEDLDTLVTRLRNGNLSYQQLIMCTNPGPPTHHLKIRADHGRMVMLYSKHEDNPRMHDGQSWTEYGSSYLAVLESLTGARYQRMRWGRWVAAEGQIYEDWDPSIHVIDPFPIPDEWTRWWAVDFGFTNPFVCQMWAEDPDGRLYLYREIYRTKRTVAEHARDIMNTVADEDPDQPGRWIWRERKPRGIVCDHDAEGRVVLSQGVGIGTIPAMKGKTDGIQVVQGRIKVAADGKPRLFIIRNAVVYRDPELVAAKKPTCTEEEIPGYIWLKPGSGAASQSPKEVPLDEDNHGCDATRYLAKERSVGAPRMRSM